MDNGHHMGISMLKVEAYRFGFINFMIKERKQGKLNNGSIFFINLIKLMQD